MSLTTSADAGYLGSLTFVGMVLPQRDAMPPVLAATPTVPTLRVGFVNGMPYQ
jgi:hypothetical protein